MHKLSASVKKEILLLMRDKGALLILFLMPAILLIAVSLIQNESFEKISDAPLKIIIIDKDKDSISKIIIKKLTNNKHFDLLTNNLTESEAKKLVFSGQYKFAIIIPKNLTKNIEQTIDFQVNDILKEFEVNENDTQKLNSIKVDKVKIYFDPAIQSNYKNSMISSFQKELKTIENQYIYSTFKEQLGVENDDNISQKEIVSIDEISNNNKNNFKPNNATHNVPAWSLFAIFFIVIPLSINIIKEKNQGIYLRLKSMPVPYTTVLAGKTICYLIICILQFWLMVFIGRYIFPLIGLSKFILYPHILSSSIIAIFSGFAAIGLGILIGVIAKSQEQAAPFGATLVVILAAIGGVWIPTFAMPKFMQYFSNISPMKWGIEAFYDVLLRKLTLLNCFPQLFALISLYFICIFLAQKYYNYIQK